MSDPIALAIAVAAAVLSSATMVMNVLLQRRYRKIEQDRLNRRGQSS